MNKEIQILNLLGLAQRAGKIVSGEDLVVKSIQDKKVQLVFLATDAGPNLVKKIEDKTNFYQIRLNNQFSSLQLSSAIGKDRKVLALADAGFSKKMRSLME